MTMIRDVLGQTGITATASIGTNMKGHCGETGLVWHRHPGQTGSAVGKERGAAVPALRRERRTADRPCVGMGTVHDGYGEGLQAGKQQLQQRTDAAIGLRLQKSACGGAGDS